MSAANYLSFYSIWLRAPLLFVFSSAFVLSLTVNTAAQESLGATLDNYTPVNGMLLNPSAIVGQRPWLDIHLLGGGGSFMNNSGYINDKRITEVASLTGISYNTNPKHAWAQIDADLLGPGFSLSKGKHAFGVHTAARVVANAQKLPLALAQSFMEENITSGNQTYHLDNARIKALAWLELGLSYGRIWSRFDRHLLTVGATLNRLFGLHGSALFIDEGTLTVIDRELSFSDGKGRFANSSTGFTRGGGWSGSVGFTYKRMIHDITHYVPHSRKVACLTLPYRFKFMASLVDVGAIRFKHESFVGTLEESGDYVEAVSISGVVDTNFPSVASSPFIATTPMALNVQYDYNFNKGFFINAFLLQRIALPSLFGVERANVLAVTPRFERRIFAASLPVSLINYRRPRVGFALRISTFTIGTEHLVPFLVPSDIYGADFYFHLRLRIFRAPYCRERQYEGIGMFRFLNIFTRKENNIEDCPEW